MRDGTRVESGGRTGTTVGPDYGGGTLINVRWDGSEAVEVGVRAGTLIKRVDPPAVKMVENMFGRMVPVTKDEFVERWTSHFRECYKLASGPEALQRLQDMGEQIGKLAGEEWERIGRGKSV